MSSVLIQNGSWFATALESNRRKTEDLEAEIWKLREENRKLKQENILLRTNAPAAIIDTPSKLT